MTTRVYIKTLGCKVNQVESEALAAQLHEQGVECVHAIEDATVVIVNTCTVTAEADTKVRKALRHAARLPQVQTVIATGCAAVLHKEELEALDAKVKVVADKRWIPGQARNDDNGDKGVRGTYKVTPFPVIQSTITSSTVILSEVSAANVVEGPQSSKHLGPSTPSATADSAQDDKGGDTRNDKRVGNAQTHTRVAVKIQDGCENFCSYCIVPYARGVCRSVGAGEVLARVRGLVEAGT
jgi:threonylcarbamoyladenosine tRNA methylthiotransferase MtaB